MGKAINESGNAKGTHAAGGKDKAQRHAIRASKNAKEPAPAAAAGGKDPAKQVALKGGQDGMGKKAVVARKGKSPKKVSVKRRGQKAKEAKGKK